VSIWEAIQNGQQPKSAKRLKYSFLYVVKSLVCLIYLKDYSTSIMKFGGLSRLSWYPHTKSLLAYLFKLNYWK
jgi:hypothetical protein